MTTEDHDILIRIDERVGNLTKCSDNHLLHHEIFERQLEERLDTLASRNIFSPLVSFVKWICK